MANAENSSDPKYLWKQIAFSSVVADNNVVAAVVVVADVVVVHRKFNKYKFERTDALIMKNPHTHFSKIFWKRKKKKKKEGQPSAYITKGLLSKVCTLYKTVANLKQA